jgi:hypothetical protein
MKVGTMTLNFPTSGDSRAEDAESLDDEGETETRTRRTSR